MPEFRKVFKYNNHIFNLRSIYDKDVRRTDREPMFDFSLDNQTKDTDKFDFSLTDKTSDRKLFNFSLNEKYMPLNSDWEFRDLNIKEMTSDQYLNLYMRTNGSSDESKIDIDSFKNSLKDIKSTMTLELSQNGKAYCTIDSKKAMYSSYLGDVNTKAAGYLFEAAINSLMKTKLKDSFGFNLFQANFNNNLNAFPDCIFNIKGSNVYLPADLKVNAATDSNASAQSNAAALPQEDLYVNLVNYLAEWIDKYDILSDDYVSQSGSVTYLDYILYDDATNIPVNKDENENTAYYDPQATGDKLLELRSIYIMGCWSSKDSNNKENPNEIYFNPSSNKFPQVVPLYFGLNHAGGKSIIEGFSRNAKDGKGKLRLKYFNDEKKDIEAQYTMLPIEVIEWLFYNMLNVEESMLSDSSAKVLAFFKKRIYKQKGTDSTEAI